MKSKHDLNCASRNNNCCDCKQGLNRRIKQKAVRTLKRQRKKIAERTGLKYEETLKKV